MAQPFKRNLVFKGTAFVIIAAFLLSSFPVGAYAGLTNSDKLRTPAARESSRADEIGGQLKDGGASSDLSRRLIVEFREVGKGDVAIAGGKGANLGELQSVDGIDVPPGVAITTEAYKQFINNALLENGMTLAEYIAGKLEEITDFEDTEKLGEVAEDIRNMIVAAEMPQEIADEIGKWYQFLCDEAGVDNLPVAIRSSATAEDLLDASFAGQQDTYLNMRGIDAVLDAVKRNWASLFTDRAIFYRNDKGISSDTAYISVIIQQMIESKIAGTAFSVTDTGFGEGIGIDAAFGLGEGVVSGTVTPDSFIVTHSGKLVRKDFGAKLQKIVYKEMKPFSERVTAEDKEATEVLDTGEEERNIFSLTDEQAIEVGRGIKIIHDHYGRFMDVEWAIDASGKLWIVQARSETVWNQWYEQNPNTVKMENTVVKKSLITKLKDLLKGIIGMRAAVGHVVIIDGSLQGRELAKELTKVKEGDMLVTTMTKPDMVPAMKRAGAIVTNEGGPTCHAAIIARELNIPYIVGTDIATKVLKDGQVIIADSNNGKVYAYDEGLVKLTGEKPEDISIKGLKKLILEKIENNVDVSRLPVTKTKIGLIVSSPFEAMKYWGFSKFKSHYGVGLLRKEFTDTTEILVHPVALMAYDLYYDANFKNEEVKRLIKEKIIDNEELRATIKETIRGYSSGKEFFKSRLASAIALIAAAQVDGQSVILRTTDFKTNEYREQIGGGLDFSLIRGKDGNIQVIPVAAEPQETNPMMGFRGLNRMLSEAYIELFEEWEIEAIKEARKIQKNIDVMFPVVRTVGELEDTIALFRKHGLERSKDFKIGMMVEVPSNVFQVEDFLRHVDFLSFGTNDLTQFVLSASRDNEKMGTIFDEMNPAVRRALEVVIKTAREMGVTSGLCGQRPANEQASGEEPAFTIFLVKTGIDSISVVADAYEPTVQIVAKVEKELGDKERTTEIKNWPSASEEEGKPEKVMSVSVDASEIIRELGIHPRALLGISQGMSIEEGALKDISEILAGRAPKDFAVDEFYQKLMQKITQTPAGTPVLLALDTLTSLDYKGLKGAELKDANGNEFEPFDENPHLGLTGLARAVDKDYVEFTSWQLEALRKAIEDSGRKNAGIVLRMARTTDEVEKAMELIKRTGLNPGEDVLVGMEISGPANVLIMDEFINKGLDFLVENEDSFLSYTQAVDPGSPYVKISQEEKRTALKRPRIIWTKAAERNGIPVMQDAFESIQTSGAKVYNAHAGGYTEFLKSLKGLKDAGGALAIGANVLFENAGALSALREIKGINPNLKLAVWTNKESEADRLRVMGAEEIVDVIGSEGLAKAVVQLEQMFTGSGLPLGRVMLVNSPADIEEIKGEFKVKNIQELQKTYRFSGVTTVQAPNPTEADINAMPIIFARAIAGLFESNDFIVKEYEEFLERNLENEKISQEDYNSLLSLGEISEIPLTRVTEEIARAQIAYKETVGKI